MSRINALAMRGRRPREQESFVRGQSLFELVLAIGVSALVIVVLVSLVSNALQNAAFSRNQTLASRYSQSATEWLRGQRDNNISTFITNVATTTWCLKDDPLTNSSWNKAGVCSASDKISGTSLTRQVTFSTATVATKTIISANVSVTWTDTKGTHKTSSATNFSDWRQR